MAARPIFRLLKERVAARGGVEVILDWVADGKTLAWIGRQFTDVKPEGVSRQLIRQYLKTNPEWYAAFERIRREETPHALVDEAVEIVDATEGERESSVVAAAKLRADTRRWLAGTLSEEYAPKPAAGVQINIGTLHLDALKAKGGAPALPAETVVEQLPAVPVVQQIPGVVEEGSTPDEPPKLEDLL
jgi:uncharacterized membrane protein